MQGQMIESQDGYPDTDIDLELPYMGVLDEFDVWLDELEEKQKCERMQEIGLEYA